MKRPLSLLFGLAALVVAAAPAPADAFCGFFVSKADTKLFNKASKVVIARQGDRTVMTMSNDFKGAPKEFAVVVPVPTFLQKEQIHVGEQSLVDHLDAFTAPRLVEYFDENPCDRRRYMTDSAVRMQAPMAAGAMAQESAKRLGVTIEATYTVGEYDILILSAKESGGLATWLTQNGYKLPQGAAPVLASYLAQNMRFFVAKVNIGEQAKLGFNYLRPLQIAYESPKFMLPIRLGTLNAEGTQELFVFALTNKGRVETTNYRTVRLPSDVEIPAYVKGDFGKFYTAMFSTQVKKQNMSTVFLEYAWDMAWCDPCAADPLSNDQLRKLGVFWLDGDGGAPQNGAIVRPGPMPRPMPRGGAGNVFVTRLHVRYDGAHFPEDLVFQETGDRANFQGRYILRHAWTGDGTCSEADAYRTQLGPRREKEAQTLASLTGWDINEIRRRQGPGPRAAAVPDKTWWERLWP
jgi:hypothetical protein